MAIAGDGHLAMSEGSGSRIVQFDTALAPADIVPAGEQDIAVHEQCALGRSIPATQATRWQDHIFRRHDPHMCRRGDFRFILHLFVGWNDPAAEYSSVRLSSIDLSSTLEVMWASAPSRLPFICDTPLPPAPTVYRFTSRPTEDASGRESPDTGQSRAEIRMAPGSVSKSSVGS